MGKITIKDIAEKMNVSANTVSKALNGKAKISEELRNKIIDVAKEMGYEKNINASRLSQGLLKIGVLINGYDENYYNYTIKGFEKAKQFLACRKVELSVEVIKADSGTSKAIGILKGFLESGFDGVIINDLHTEFMLPVLEEYDKSGIKYSFLNYDFPKNKRTFAMINDYSCAAGLAAELLSVSVEQDKALVVYSKSDNCIPQKMLTDSFCEKAEISGRDNIKIVSETDDVFKVDNIGGIYVSHASYLEVCERAEKIWDDKTRPKIVVSDLYEECIPFLERGIITAIIYQNPEQQAYLSAVKLYEVIGENKCCDDVITITPVIIMKSNYKKYLNG